MTSSSLLYEIIFLIVMLFIGEGLFGLFVILGGL
uniref:Uncharacterized protein n=1 Tax=Anguilla anguilla TaxID=7936 RepID=A0A0E9VHE6_ANGAN